MKKLISVKDIDNLQESVADLEAKKHWHDNKTDLDALIEKHGQLTFQGTPISGNTFLYDNVIGGKLMWKDPTDPEAEATEVANSLAIANAFITTPMAWAGMILQVVEVDGSFTTFVAIKTSEEGIRRNLKYLNQIKSDRRYYDYTVEVDDYTEIPAAEATRIITEGEEGHDLFFTERKLDIVPYTTTTTDSRGSIIFVDTLPTNSVVYDGRGVWYPMYDDGVYAPNQPYISINGSWKKVTSLDGSGSTKAVPGAKFTLAYCDDDPQMPFKRNHLFWSEPVDSETFKAWWKESVIVRKFGSAPSNVNDGEKILTITSRATGGTGFVDTCPYSNENVYYRLFSYTRGGSLYANTDAVSPEPITWDTFFNIANKGMLNNVFKVGDTITLPKHPLFGNIDCEVISITEATDTTKGCVRVATKDALGHLAFGSTNEFEGSDLETWLNDTFYMYTALKLTTDGVAQPRITYYVFDGTFKPLNIAVGAAFPEGVDVYQTDTEHPTPELEDVEELISEDNSSDQSSKRIFRTPRMEDSWTIEGSMIKVYVDSIVPVNHLRSIVNVGIDIVVNTKIINVKAPSTENAYIDESNDGVQVVKTKSRVTTLTKCILALLNGASVQGVGKMIFSNEQSIYNKAQYGL